MKIVVAVVEKAKSPVGEAVENTRPARGAFLHGYSDRPADTIVVR
jgi:hypothetical protein